MAEVKSRALGASLLSVRTFSAIFLFIFFFLSYFSPFSFPLFTILFYFIFLSRDPMWTYLHVRVTCWIR